MINLGQYLTPQQYAVKEGWGLDVVQCISLITLHQVCTINGDTHNKKWIESLFEDINYHTELGFMLEGKWDEAITFYMDLTDLYEPN